VRAELALGALTGRERAEALAHLEHCLACQEKVRRLMTQGEKLLELLPAAEPPPGFEHRVLEELRVHAREELGVDPSELPSPLLAGASSLAAFSSGALIPLLPYLFGLNSLVAALAITAAALLAGGMTVGRLTGRPVLRSGLRQLALGAVAVTVTFAVGSLIGAQVH
jgi:VIT1/CCC1 family predicted Fe2+/Mn2+ transporter